MQWAIAVGSITHGAVADFFVSELSKWPMDLFGVGVKTPSTR